MRYERLDILRGVAIVLMVLFHLNYSLVHIFGMETLNFSEIFWYITGKTAALGFMSIAGISFFLAEKKYGKAIFKKYIQYSVILAVLAGIISLSTYLFFPEQYIRFGIIHFFAFSFLLLPFFALLRSTNIIIGIFIIIYGVFFIPIIENKHFFFLGFRYPGFDSADYYPLFPYFGVLLLGYSAAILLEKYKKISVFQKKSRNNLLDRFFIHIGRNSLLVYIIHQPIIVAIIGGINFIV